MSVTLLRRERVNESRSDAVNEKTPLSPFSKSKLRPNLVVCFAPSFLNAFPTASCRLWRVSVRILLVRESEETPPRSSLKLFAIFSI